jgi:hypothetical protein
MRTTDVVVIVENASEISDMATAEGTSGIREAVLDNVEVSTFSTLQAAAEAALANIDREYIVLTVNPLCFGSKAGHSHGRASP